MIKRPFTAKGYKAQECLQLMHTKLCEPFNVHGQGGYEYFITFTDDYSRFGSICLIHRKFNALDKFIEFKMEFENQLGKHIKTLQSDRGGEYMSNQFNSFFKDQGLYPI